MTDTITVSQIVDEDVTNYRKCAMFVGTVKCSFKCCTELGLPVSVCQNSELCKAAHHTVPVGGLVDRYLGNKLTEAVVFGGMEPMDQFDEVMSFITELRKRSEDDVVIYTGYTEDEMTDNIERLKGFRNIVVKFGRFRPDEKKHRDEVLGVDLISNNQYARRVS